MNVTEEPIVMPIGTLAFMRFAACPWSPATFEQAMGSSSTSFFTTSEVRDGTLWFERHDRVIVLSTITDSEYEKFFKELPSLRDDCPRKDSVMNSLKEHVWCLVFCGNVVGMIRRDWVTLNPARR